MLHFNSRRDLGKKRSFMLNRMFCFVNFLNDYQKMGDTPRPQYKNTTSSFISHLSLVWYLLMVINNTPPSADD